MARNAIAAQPLDEVATETLSDLAEGLLLARGAAGAEQARDAVLEGLALLVTRHDLTRRAAVRFWTYLRACGPDVLAADLGSSRVASPAWQRAAHW